MEDLLPVWKKQEVVVKPEEKRPADLDVVFNEPRDEDTGSFKVLSRSSRTFSHSKVLLTG